MTTMETSNILPCIAIHPGDSLGAELKERGIKQKDFAREIGMLPSHLNELIKGKRDVTMDIAKRLESALGISAESWLRYQSMYYDTVKANEERSVKEQEAKNALEEYNKVFDVRVAIKRLGINTEVVLTTLVRNIQEVLHLPAPANMQLAVSGRFKKSAKTVRDERMALTWVLLAEHYASHVDVSGRFDDANREAMIDELCRIFHANEDVTRKVGEALSRYGIRFCVVEKVEKASIDGYSFIKDGIPAIVVTQRYKNIDNFAFDVMHEVGHICFGHIKEGEYSFYEEDSRQEKEANSFAANTLIPPSMWDTSPKVQMKPHIVQREYSKWAADNGLNRWIVLGRISKEFGMYQFCGDGNRKIS